MEFENREIKFAPVVDHELVLRAANEYLGGRYPDQNQFIIDRLQEEGQATPGLIVATALHDIVHHAVCERARPDHQIMIPVPCQKLSRQPG